MPKYLTKPIEVEAEQFLSGRKIEGVCDAVHLPSNVQDYVDGSPHLHTLEGIYFIKEGDWVVTTGSDYRTICKPDMFVEIYMPKPETIDGAGVVIAVSDGVQINE
ncbi:MAG: hypothetical protein KAS32_25010 [Candidatus Peribacteraceae bacterium]|nr:hypothetical protein [Candidatus Peribacteraceae bacterium]